MVIIMIIIKSINIMRETEAIDKWFFLIVFLVFFVVNNGYSKENQDKIISTDYSVVTHWLSLPAPVKEIDVFYLYPTVWHKDNPSESNICAIDNVSMLDGSKNTFVQQATAFETVGNIYAPYYRQADGAYSLRLTDSERQKLEYIPIADVIAAFDYYIKHFNNGRPFILAAHSQGSIVMLALLKSLVENQEVYSRMIAAYAIGWPVTKEFVAENPKLKFAAGSKDTGVIISFNTQSPNVAPGANPIVPGKTGLVINPITWTRDETVATTAQGLGSWMPDNTERTHYIKVPQYADAKVDNTNGVLICSTADESQMYSSMGKGIYHGYDYLFYYFNIRQNAEDRANKYLGK